MGAWHVGVQRPRMIPLWLKVLYTLFVCVLVPVYWKTYGPVNFLYFCDVAVLVTLPAIWLEHRLLLSIQAVAIVVPQLLWLLDLLAFAGMGWGLAMTGYMLDSSIPLLTRALSSFHGWMPLLLLYLVWKLGYDRRALIAQCACGIVLLLICYFFTPQPPAPTSNPTSAVNINFVFGPGKDKPQQWMPPGAWLAMLLALFPVAFYLPAHLLFVRFCPARPTVAGSPAVSG